MNGSVIRADNLGKRYRIGERERYLALRDVFTRWLRAPARMLQRSAASSRNGERDYIWALRGVSFEVRQGEVLGIIGRNGAGKTTLLKILARVTRPTEGCAEVRGRMGSLLEVGTGFHQELTGRENLYLSGAILGMSKLEIDQKFDEIVAFSEVEKFLDTPLKHYSMGMMMRLAFAVAAHLEPEILLVDEVLAVGDLEFQKKCLGKMSKVAEGGRTILFVSHQMNQIRRLCQRVVWVDAGGIRCDGPAKDVVSRYEASCADLPTTAPEEARGSIAFPHWEVEDSQSNVLDLDRASEKIVIRIHARVGKPIHKGKYFIGLRDINNVMVWSDLHHGVTLDPGAAVFVHVFARLPLNPGIYSWDVRVHDGHRWQQHTLLPSMSITSDNDSHAYQHIRGFLNLESSFAVEPLPERIA
jgi:homopolymeric O-antigen transport system ATP-binding protein